MSEIQQNRYDQLLRRVADIKGAGSKVNDALTELFPTIDVENVPAELLLLSGARMAMGHVSLNAGGVGNFSTAFLRNNGGTGILGRVTSVEVFSPTAQRITFGPTQNSSAASGTRAFTDGRVFGEGTTLITQGNNNFLAFGADFYRISVDGIVSAVWKPPGAGMIITPATALSVSATLGDTSLQVSFVWVERVAQPSELNL